MKVETYEVTEILADGTVEFEQEQIALIEKLGLEGQQNLIKRGDAGEKNIVPYRKMTKEEKIVYETLCPNKCSLSDYEDSAIPLRVLQVAAHANSLDIGELKVWSSTSSDVKDPVLVIESKKNYTYSYWLLARWAEMLEPYEVLKRKAVEVLKKKKERLYKLMKEHVEALGKKLVFADSVEEIDQFPASVSSYDVER